VGKDADLVLYDKHPLSSYAVAQKVFVDGNVYFDRMKDIEERGKKELVKKQMIDRAKEQERLQQKKMGPPPAGARRPA
jgi:hypothetical protein